jgi:hypothetical protein
MADTEAQKTDQDFRTLFSVYSEFCNFHLVQCNGKYSGHMVHYVGGEVVRTDSYSYPEPIPNDLLQVLIEANPSRLSTEHEGLIWDLADEQYEV